MSADTFPEATFPDVSVEPTGPDLVSQNQSPLSQLAQSPMINELRTRATEILGDLPERGADLVRNAERKTRENPWIAIVAAAAGALAIGFIAGRILSRGKFVAYTEEEYPAGYDE